MNENLNLVEILKDCPKGMELDCTMYDYVTFDGIKENCCYPIRVVIEDGNTMSLTKYGQYTDDDFAKCIIFPKGETTWEGFIHPYKFKDGDIVATYTGNWIGITTGGHAHSYMPTYCVLCYNREVKLYFGRKVEWGFDRLATEEEKQRLFDAIKEEGYKWNAETKTLEKLVKPKTKFKVGDKIVNRVNMYMGDLSHQCVISEITEDKYILNDGGYIYFKDQDIWELAPDKKQRFDPKTLQPFDKVLAKFGSHWTIELFSNMYEYMGDIYYTTGY